jgi:hypothetical protein
MICLYPSAPVEKAYAAGEWRWLRTNILVDRIPFKVTPHILPLGGIKVALLTGKIVLRIILTWNLFDYLGI